jgi:hypothetical protein
MGDVIQGVDFIEVVKKVGRKNRKLQAKLLQRLELEIDKDTLQYSDLRKFVLDETSSFTRAVIRDIFGDIEFLLR